MLLIPSFTSYLVATERSLTCQLKSRAEVEEETLEVRQKQAETCSIICLMVQRPVLNTKMWQGTFFFTLIFLFFAGPQPTNGGHRRVLFHTQPDVLYLTLQDGGPATSLSPPDVEEDEDDEDVCATNRHLDTQTHPKYKRSPR